MKKNYLSPSTKIYSLKVESAGFAAGSVGVASFGTSYGMDEIDSESASSSTSSPQLSQFDILDSPSNQMENPFD